MSYANSETRNDYNTYGISVNSKNLTNEDVSIVSEDEDILFCINGDIRRNVKLNNNPDFEIIFKAASKNGNIKIQKKGTERHLKIKAFNNPDPDLSKIGEEFDDELKLGYKIYKNLSGGGSNCIIVISSKEELLQDYTPPNTDIQHYKKL
jgi:hypothetical protein